MGEGAVSMKRLDVFRQRPIKMSFDILVFSPDSFPQAEVLIAASLAGHTGVLALDDLPPDDIAGALSELTAANIKFHVSVDVIDDDRQKMLQSAASYGLQGVVFTDANHERLGDSIEWCRAAGLRVMVQVTSIEQALRGVQHGAERLIVKGSEAGGRVGEETTFVLLQHVVSRVEIPVYARGGIGLHTAAACLCA